MTGPKHVSDVGKWRLLRWEYDGAPLMAEHPHRPDPRRSRLGLSIEGAWTVEIDQAGDLVFDGLPFEGANPSVPVEVLRELVDDAIARGVWQR